MTRVAQQLGATVLVAAGVFAARADACDCRGAEGIGSAYTASDERWAIAASTMVRRAVATWDSAGYSHTIPQNMTAFDATLQIGLGVRVIRRLELSASTGAGLAFFRAPGATADHASLTDSVARARFDLSREDSHGGPPVASAVWLGVRAPTASLAQSVANGASGAIGAFGLGTWEFALGTDIRHTFHDVWQPFAAVEGALRAPDNSFGVPRALGPRLSARIGLSYFVTPTLSLSTLADWSWEGDVRAAGQTLVDSWQHRSSLSLMLTSYAPHGLRTSVALAADLPIDGLGRNNESTVRIQIALAYGSVRPQWQTCEMHENMTVRRRGDDDFDPTARRAAF